MNDALQSALAPTACIDADHPQVAALAASLVAGSSDARSQAVALYLHVRDAYRYDPYHIDLTVAGMRASSVLTQGRGWCIPKACLLAALCRSVGIPARVGLADVKNHLATPRLIASMGTDVFYRHGYTSIWLGGQWLKATPAFNIELCQKMRIHPLDFDGQHDSIYHPYDLDGQRHMEYVAQHGEFDELPLADIRTVFLRHYPGLMQLQSADWEADVDRMAQDGLSS
jgi:transglutaminase-like putative cysteine protease